MSSFKIREPLTANKNKQAKLFIQRRHRHRIVKVACALERSVEHALPITLSQTPVTEIEQLAERTDRDHPEGRCASCSCLYLPCKKAGGFKETSRDGDEGNYSSCFS